VTTVSLTSSAIPPHCSSFGLV